MQMKCLKKAWIIPPTNSSYNRAYRELQIYTSGED